MTGGTLENLAESSGSTLQASGSVAWNRLYICWTAGRGMWPPCGPWPWPCPCPWEEDEEAVGGPDEEAMPGEGEWCRECRWDEGCGWNRSTWVWKGK